MPEALSLYVINGSDRERVCSLRYETGRLVHIVDEDFVVALYKREGVDTKTLPAIQVGLPPTASEEDKQHFVGFAKFLVQGLQGTSLPKYAEIRLPHSRNLCVWLCPPANPATFDATCKLDLLVPPILISSYSFSPVHSPLPSPTSRPKTVNAMVDKVDENYAKMQSSTSDVAAETMASSHVARAQTPPPPPLHALPSPRSLVKLSPPKNVSMKKDKSLLTKLSQNHTWLLDDDTSEKEQVPSATAASASLGRTDHKKARTKKEKKKQKENQRQDDEKDRQAKKHRHAGDSSKKDAKPRFFVSRSDCTLIKILALPHLSLASVPGGTKVAFKSTMLRQDDNSYSAFREELKKLRQLSHENLVPVVAARMEATGPPAVGYAYQEGVVDLNAVLLKPQTVVSLDERLFMASKVAEALDFLHCHGVVHGALRPSNVLVSSFPTPKLRTIKLTDHGIAHRALGGATVEGIAFSAPEALAPPGGKEGKQLLPSRDMWSMGILLLELMSGRKAWGVSRSAQELRRLIGKFSLASLPGLHHLRNLSGGQQHEVLEEVGRLVEACLQKKESERIASEELLRKLMAQMEEREGTVE